MKIRTAEKSDALERFDALILPLCEGETALVAALEEPQAELLVKNGGFRGKAEEIAHLTRLSGGRVQHILLLGLGKEPDHETLLFASSQVFRRAAALGAESAAILADAFSGEELGLLCESALLSDYRFEKYKSEKDEKRLKEAVFFCENGEKTVSDAVIRGEATLHARDLINEPPSVMTPERLSGEIAALLDGSGVKLTVYGREEIEALGMHAFLNVGKGSVCEPKLIVMEYDGSDSVERLGLVGKGLTYDSGGYSLQSSEFMETMQHDMSGGAAVAAAIWAAAKLGLKLNVTGVIAACENKLSATAFVPGDVIPSMSGKYIEVNNTDAEGRLTLADAITYIQKCHRVDRIVDIATLTDAIQTALGDRRAGIFSNDPALARTVWESGERTVEPVWELPCDKYVRHVLDSRVAALKNSAMGSSVGAYATVGAMFVKEFVEKPWVHIDIGGVGWSRENDYYFTKGGVGFGVRLLVDFMKHAED